MLWCNYCLAVFHAFVKQRKSFSEVFLLFNREHDCSIEIKPNSFSCTDCLCWKINLYAKFLLIEAEILKLTIYYSLFHLFSEGFEGFRDHIRDIIFCEQVQI